MKTDNELIAEFMEWSHCNGPSCIESDNLCWCKNDGHSYIPKKDLKFDTSWDWLMPVVEKINSLNGVSYTIEGKCAMEIGRNGCRIAFYTSDSMIETVYKAVVEFIKWYNEIKKP